MIQFQTPDFTTAELTAVEIAMGNGWVGPGAETDAFVDEFARHAGVPVVKCVPVSSCTDGLFFIMQVIAARSGGEGEVLMPSICYVGVAQAVIAAGLTPRFCDVDPRTLNATARTINQQLSPATVAVVVLHYGGFPCEMQDILAMSAARGLIVIEDAACAPASYIEGMLCGTLGDFGTWSFDAAKMITAIEGGIVYAREPSDALAVERLANMGMCSRSGFQRASDQQQSWWAIYPEGQGRRSVFPSLHAAVGRIQLRRITDIRRHRQFLWNYYYSRLEHLPELVLPPSTAADSSFSYYYFWIYVAEEVRDGLATFLLNKGIFTTFKYMPLHEITLFNSSRSILPHAEKASRTSLLLPLHCKLNTEDVDFVCNSIYEHLQQVS